MPKSRLVKGKILFAMIIGVGLSVPVQAADGEQVYRKTCKTCHGDGIGGAPMVGDKDAWQARIDKGMETLYKHAIKGFKGRGLMPPKGGRSSLSADEVRAAVDYMVSISR